MNEHWVNVSTSGGQNTCRKIGGGQDRGQRIFHDPRDIEKFGSKPSPNPSGERRGKDGAEVLLEGIEVDVLDGEKVLVENVLLAPALGLSDEDPVGGHVARSQEVVAFDKNPLFFFWEPLREFLSRNSEPDFVLTLGK